MAGRAGGGLAGSACLRGGRGRDGTRRPRKGDNRSPFPALGRVMTIKEATREGLP